MLVYHTGRDKAIVGIAQAATGAYPDPKQGDPKLVVFDVQ
ncbi:MAG: EVE domain-containing protein, partial [Proteobacteria bacterium]|nr:EVE domain-containing protein [Pseudomonadota bacterium]